MHVPQARGPISQWVREVLNGSDPGECPTVPFAVTHDQDAQLALWMSYEVHYRGFDGVPADLEWDLRLLGVRRRIEERFEGELRKAITVESAVAAGVDLGPWLLQLAESHEGVGLAPFLQREATIEQMLDYLSQRSVSQLKESDPHSFVLGRLEGAAKAALAELQYDEYGGGDPQRLHASLYKRALEAAGLDPAYGAYVPDASAVTLASANLMSIFAFNRRLRGASMGHLAIFEASSSVPCRRISAGLERLGFDASVRRYFDEHVQADAVHEQVAAHDICGAMVAQEPDLRDDVVFGAMACLHMDDLVARDFFQRWGTDLGLAS